MEDAIHRDRDNRAFVLNALQHRRFRLKAGVGTPNVAVAGVFVERAMKTACAQHDHVIQPYLSLAASWRERGSLPPNRPPNQDLRFGFAPLQPGTCAERRSSWEIIDNEPEKSEIG